MKNPLRFSIVVAVLLLLGGGLFFVLSSPQFQAVDTDQVASVTVWNHENDRQLSAEEVTAVIEAYNAAIYGGKATGEGGTPDFGARILLKNGYTILVNDFSGKSEVFTNDLFGRGFYLESAELYGVVEELAKKQ
ncbi:MAG: hypothetical protein IKA63_03785 [Clostridia bacterium]|nr:hypothetical protein [Clostridia bacterium]